MTATQNLSMARGDTLSFDIRLSDLDGATINSLYFTVKKKASDEMIIFQESMGNGITKVDDTTYRVRVAPEDTHEIPVTDTAAANENEVS